MTKQSRFSAGDVVRYHEHIYLILSVNTVECLYEVLALDTLIIEIIFQSVIDHYYDYVKTIVQLAV